MRTPKEYTKNLKDHIITLPMLVDCLYSSNKRAKNWRDKESEYRYESLHNRYWNDYGNEEKAREKKESRFAYTEKLLKRHTENAFMITKTNTGSMQTKILFTLAVIGIRNCRNRSVLEIS